MNGAEQVKALAVLMEQAAAKSQAVTQDEVAPDLITRPPTKVDLEHRAEVVVELNGHPGWVILVDQMKSERQALMVRLLKERDVQEIARIQGKLSILDAVIQWPANENSSLMVLLSES